MIDLIGGEGQNRTVDTTIFSRMLYQLSYLATQRVRRHRREPAPEGDRKSYHAAEGAGNQEQMKV